MSQDPKLIIKQRKQIKTQQNEIELYKYQNQLLNQKITSLNSTISGFKKIRSNLSNESSQSTIPDKHDRDRDLGKETPANFENYQILQEELLHKIDDNMKLYNQLDELKRDKLEKDASYKNEIESLTESLIKASEKIANLEAKVDKFTCSESSRSHESQMNSESAQISNHNSSSKSSSKSNLPENSRTKVHITQTQDDSQQTNSSRSDSTNKNKNSRTLSMSEISNFCYEVKFNFSQFYKNFKVLFSNVNLEVKNLDLDVLERTSNYLQVGQYQGQYDNPYDTCQISLSELSKYSDDSFKYSNLEDDSFHFYHPSIILNLYKKLQNNKNFTDKIAYYVSKNELILDYLRDRQRQLICDDYLSEIMLNMVENIECVNFHLRIIGHPNSSTSAGRPGPGFESTEDTSKDTNLINLLKSLKTISKSINKFLKNLSLLPKCEWNLGFKNDIKDRASLILKIQIGYKLALEGLYGCLNDGNERLLSLLDDQNNEEIYWQGFYGAVFRILIMFFFCYL